MTRCPSSIMRRGAARPDKLEISKRPPRVDFAMH
jgi:hypothetical protein